MTTEIIKIHSAAEQHSISMDIYNVEFDVETTMNNWQDKGAGFRLLQEKIDRSSPDSFGSFDIIQAFDAWKANQNWIKELGLNGEFNTGRHYGPEGQKISWKCVDLDVSHDDGDGDDTFWDVVYFTVIFEDHTRGIKGKILLLGNDPEDKITQDMIMKAYDKGDYQNV